MQIPTDFFDAIHVVQSQEFVVTGEGQLISLKFQKHLPRSLHNEKGKVELGLWGRVTHLLIDDFVSLQKPADCHHSASQMNQLDSLGINSLLSIYDLLPQIKVIVMNRMLVLFIHYPFFLLHLGHSSFLLHIYLSTLQRSTFEKFEATFFSLQNNISSNHDIYGIVYSPFGVLDKEVEISTAMILVFVFLSEEVDGGLSDSWKVFINDVMPIIRSDCYFVYDITQNLNRNARVVNQHALDVIGDCLQILAYVRP